MAGRGNKKSVFEKFMDLDTSDDEQRQDDAELKDKQKQKKKARSKKKNRCEALCRILWPGAADSPSWHLLCLTLTVCGCVGRWWLAIARY